MWDVRQLRLTLPTERSFLLASRSPRQIPRGFDEVGVTGRGGQSQCEMGPSEKGALSRRSRDLNTRKNKCKSARCGRDSFDSSVSSSGGCYREQVNAGVSYWHSNPQWMTMWAYGVIGNEAREEANITNHPASGGGFICSTREETRKRSLPQIEFEANTTEDAWEMEGWRLCALIIRDRNLQEHFSSSLLYLFDRN